MVVCDQCGRHHRVDEGRCPFCSKNRTLLGSAGVALTTVLTPFILAACYGCPHPGCKGDTGWWDTGDTGAFDPGDTGDADVDDTGSGDTGSGDTGSGDTGSGDTGSGDTGGVDPGIGDALRVVIGLDVDPEYPECSAVESD
jgi:hypothetical protein